MYNPNGARQLNAFAARAVLRLPDVGVLDGPTGRAEPQPGRPPENREAPQAPIEP